MDSDESDLPDPSSSVNKARHGPAGTDSKAFSRAPASLNLGPKGADGRSGPAGTGPVVTRPVPVREPVTT